MYYNKRTGKYYPEWDVVGPLKPFLHPNTPFWWRLILGLVLLVLFAIASFFVVCAITLFVNVPIVGIIAVIFVVGVVSIHLFQSRKSDEDV